MNRKQAEQITREIGTLINAHLMARDTGRPSSLYAVENRIALADLLVEATGPAAPEPDCMPVGAALITKDGTQLEPGITLTLYHVNLSAGTTMPVTGLIAHDGFLVAAAHPLAQVAYKVNDLYASHIKAWNAHKSYKASQATRPAPRIIGNEPSSMTLDDHYVINGQAWLYRVLPDTQTVQELDGCVHDGWLEIVTPNSVVRHQVSALYYSRSNAVTALDNIAKPAPIAAALEYHTRDMATLKTDKIYALWYCDGITQEILRVNGRVTSDGKLAELAGMDAASMDVSGLYFWRVNCLKDQLAAQSPDVAATEYTDNAEMDTDNDDDNGQD